MNAIALLLAAQAVPPAMLEAADRANQAYVQCLFAVSRSASAVHVDVEAFRGRLASACTSEEAALVRAGAAVLARRGEPNAASKMRQVTQDARRSVVDTYRFAAQLAR
jgi:hypothetical protein